MKLSRLTTLVAVLAIMISGCQSDLDMRYLDSSLGERLELPPDLIASEDESSFELPEIFSGDDIARDKVPVLARVDSLHLEGSDNFYWLSVDEPVDNLYQLVKNFWAAEGYRLLVDEPVIGVMQTEWIYKEVGSVEGSGNWLERLFGDQDLSAVQDQFKTRIERDPKGGSRIYIAHRGAEYNYVLDTNDRGQVLDNSSNDSDSNWQARLPDPELEIEMLSRMMIYLGLQQAEVDYQLANVKLFQSRAFIQRDAEENSPFLIMKDPYHIAWNRIYHNLERLNFEIVSSEFKSGLLEDVGTFIVNIEVKESQKQGGLFALVSSTETDTRQIALILSEETHEMTRVEIEDEKGEFDTSAEGAEFLNLLYQQVK